MDTGTTGTLGLEPGTLYAFKLGPVAVEEGQANVYLGVAADGGAAGPVLSARDSKGLEELARKAGGRRLLCEPRLARAGAKWGFEPRERPKGMDMPRACLALMMEWQWQEQMDAGHLMMTMLAATLGLWQAQPWKWWMNEELLEVRLKGAVAGKREGSLLGNGGEMFGFVLYDKPGAHKELERQEGWGAELRSPDGLSLLLMDEPRWVRQAVKEATGLPRFPLPLRTRQQEALPVRPEELLALLAVAVAVMRLTPEDREQEAEVEVQGKKAKAWVRAPEPLLYGPRARQAGTQEKAAAKPPPLPPIPQRKISEVLLEYAEPCMADMGAHPDERELRLRLEFAMHVWNAVVLDTWGPQKGFIQQMRQTLRDAPPGPKGMSKALLELMVHRKQAHFANDPRLMTGLQLVRGPGGDLRVRLEARMPGSATG